MTSKDSRLRAIADLIRADAWASQKQLAERLSGLGFVVTQATVSRDLDHIGAVKTRRAGKMGYVLPDQVRDQSGPQLGALLRDWARVIEPAAALVIVKTPPGTAHLIGVALDNSDYPEIRGTICGDDTTFIATASQSAAEVLATKLRSAAALIL